MNNLKYIIALLSALIPLTLQAQVNDTLTLNDVLKQVISHNDRLTAARYMEKAAYAKIGPAGAWDDPMLMLGVVNVPTSFDFKMDDMTMRMIGISQNIPYAGQKHMQTKAARADAEASGEEKRGMVVDMATAAKYAYYDLYYRQLILKDMNDQKQLLQDILNSAMAKIQTNQANQSDVSAAQADLWRLESEILSTQQMIDESQNNIYALMGKEPVVGSINLKEPELTSLPNDASDWIKSAGESYPPLRKMKKQSDSYKYSASAARRMRWPMLNLSADYGFRYPDPMGMARMNMVNIQATLSLPIFSGRQQGKMALSMFNMKEGVDAEYNQMLLDIKADLQSLHTKAKRLTQSLNLYRERIIPTDYDAYKSAMAGYTADRIQFINLLTYGITIYRDKIASNQIAFDLSRTIAEAEKYYVNPDDYGLTR